MVVDLRAATRQPNSNIKKKSERVPEALSERNLDQPAIEWQRT